MKLYRIVDKAKNYTSVWISDYSLIQSSLDGYRWCFDDYKDKDRIFIESVTIPEESLEPELEEAYEWKNNKLATITKTVSTNLKDYLDNPIEGYEKAFRLRPGNGYYDFLDDDEDECKDFAIFDGTPTIHGFIDADDDYFITIFKHNHTYVAYVVREYECGGPIGSFILKRDNYEDLLKKLNETIYSY